MPQLFLRGLAKRFGDVAALDGLSLEVGDGELMCLLGPSGCGKTTTLRLIAGFEEPSAGRVVLGGEDITALPPQRRGIGVVFQSYALFPHLTVAENVGFGLKMRRWAKNEIAARVEETLRLVQLAEVGARLPRQLSGGQQQRVALARALAIQPGLLLLDEPLSNLDAKLRDETREEIRRVQRKVGITTIMVTHDQGEALAMGDRMAVLDRGRLMQVGTPAEIYQRPANPFVASFIGQSTLISGIVIEMDGRLSRIATAGGMNVVGLATGLASGDEVLAVVKSERIVLSPRHSLATPNSFEALVESRTYLGSVERYICRCGDETLDVVQPTVGSSFQPSPGETVFVEWSVDDCLVLSRAG
jgi:putative spermidine/putrescine transport system ATP-binding protein